MFTGDMAELSSAPQPTLSEDDNSRVFPATPTKSKKKNILPLTLDPTAVHNGCNQDQSAKVLLSWQQSALPFHFQTIIGITQRCTGNLRGNYSSLFSFLLYLYDQNPRSLLCTYLFLSSSAISFISVADCPG
jgi:hypothetical protein